MSIFWKYWEKNRSRREHEARRVALAISVSEVDTGLWSLSTTSSQMIMREWRKASGIVTVEDDWLYLEAAVSGKGSLWVFWQKLKRYIRRRRKKHSTR